MNIGIANDHHGVELKQELTNYLKELGYNVVNFGCDSEEMVDYCDYAFKIGEAVSKKEIDYGVLICNTGIGMSIACNKVKGIRCAKIDNEIDAKYAKCHNNANVIALSANKELEEIIRLIDIFSSNEFMKEQHEIRLNKIMEYENEY